MKRNHPSITRSALYENLSQHAGTFRNLSITDASSALDAKVEREMCETCGQSRKWFCYSCRLPLNSLRHVFPKVELPFRVDIIKHPREPDGKSTGVHAAVLSDDVNIHTYPDIPNYDPRGALLIFPDNSTFASHCEGKLGDGKSACRLCGNMHQTFPFDTVVFIDSSWAQAKRIYMDDRVAALPFRAGLTGRKSVFWRPTRNREPEHLATVEAIHQVCSEWLKSQSCQQAHKVDNLLFLFKYMHNKISTRYRDM